MGLIKPDCAAGKASRTGADCDGNVAWAVTYRSARDGRLLDHTPGCMRHTLEECDRAHAAGITARVDVTKLFHVKGST